MKKLWLFGILAMFPLFCHSQVSYLNLDTLTPASTPNTSTPGWNIDTVPATTGGVNSPASATQTISNSSPAGAPTGVSMLDTMTTLATSTQTNVLWWYWATGCDSCTNFVQDQWIYVTNIAAANNIEMDFDQYNLSQGKLHSFGHQCHIGGNWEYANNSSGWQNTSVACSLPAGWHHIIWTGHQTSTTNYYDELTVDGTPNAINTTLASETLPGGYPSALIDQFQIDAGPTTGTAATISYNLDEVNFTASGVTPGAVSTLQYLLR